MKAAHATGKGGTNGQRLPANCRSVPYDTRAAMAINEILGRRDDLNESVPVDWPLQLSAGEFASECLGMAAHYEGLASGAR